MRQKSQAVADLLRNGHWPFACDFDGITSVGKRNDHGLTRRQQRIIRCDSSQTPAVTVSIDLVAQAVHEKSSKSGQTPLGSEVERLLLKSVNRCHFRSAEEVVCLSCPRAVIDLGTSSQMAVCSGPMRPAGKLSLCGALDNDYLK